MNTTKTKLAVVGGVAAVAILAAGYFTWSAYSKMTAAREGSDGDDETAEVKPGLDEVLGQVKNLTGKADAIFPSSESVAALTSNETVVTAWKDEAMRLASRGDRTYKSMTASELKSFFESDAKRIAALPGGVMVPGLPETKLTKPTFTFGPFKGYVIDGDMPQEDPKKVAELQRQWDDFATVAEALSACGIVELTDVVLKSAQSEEEATQKKGAKKKAKSVRKEAAGKEPVANTYVFSFTTRPAAFVKVVNALATCERFVVVDDFTFAREKDAIGLALGGVEQKEEVQATGGRRSRRRGSAARAEETKKKPDANGDVVTDPQLDSPLKVDMTVTVYDFRSMEEGEGSK